jgi:hypothetical protein
MCQEMKLTETLGRNMYHLKAKKDRTMKNVRKKASEYFIILMALYDFTGKII